MHRKFITKIYVFCQQTLNLILNLKDKLWGLAPNERLRMNFKNRASPVTFWKKVLKNNLCSLKLL